MLYFLLLFLSKYEAFYFSFISLFCLVPWHFSPPPHQGLLFYPMKTLFLLPLIIFSLLLFLSSLLLTLTFPLGLFLSLYTFIPSVIGSTIPIHLISLSLISIVLVEVNCYTLSDQCTYWSSFLFFYDEEKMRLWRRNCMRADFIFFLLIFISSSFFL